MIICEVKQNDNFVFTLWTINNVSTVSAVGGDVCCQMVIIIGNGHNNQSSNFGQCYLTIKTVKMFLPIKNEYTWKKNSYNTWLKEYNSHLILERV